LTRHFNIPFAVATIAFALPPWNPVDTSLIESMITEICAEGDTDPELHDLLAVVADREGVTVGPEDLVRGERFIDAYIKQVPYMIKIAWTASSSVGIEAQMKKILQMVESYWLEGDDVIPDELGVIGLLDDAYCSLTSLQAVSDHYRLQTGKHLFPNDLGAANRAMRKIIGEPYASELDRIVIRTMTETGLIEVMKSLADEEKRHNFEANSTIWGHGPVDEFEIADLKKLGLL
jgi:uncharacterized membrane protein YkvA (DUF1232 family)